MGIYPNPLHPDRYLVINSGFTFHAQAAGSNARHVPMLPDWAVVDAAAPPGARIAAAGFYGERWELRDPP